MAKAETRIDWESSKYSPNHDFETEPVVEGKLVKEGSVTIKGRDAKFVVLETDKGEVTVWLGAVLESNLADEAPEIGDLVGIKYLGAVKGKAGYKYRDYDVRIVRAEAEEGE